MIKWPGKYKNQHIKLPFHGRKHYRSPFNVSDGTGTKQISHSCRTFLQQKRLVPLQGFELNSLRSCRIALLFCLPVLELGLEWLDGFHEVLIYPAPFVVDDEWEDDIGLVHNQRIVQSGQSWQQGPIVLNWLDIQDSLMLLVLT